MIKYRDKDIDTLRRAVKNFNAKISRLQKKQPQNIDLLPDKVTMKGLKGSIATRADFNRAVKRLQRFSRKGAEEIVKLPSGAELTRWEIKEARYNLQSINAKRRAAAKRAAPSGKVEAAALTPYKPDLGKIPSARLKETLKSIENMASDAGNVEKDKKYINSTLKALDKFLPEQNKGDLAKLFSKFNPRDLADALRNNPNIDIPSIYCYEAGSALTALEEPDSFSQKMYESELKEELAKNAHIAAQNEADYISNLFIEFEGTKYESLIREYAEKHKIDLSHGIGILVPGLTD